MIYVVQAEIGGPVKIGYTTADDVSARLRALQIGSPVKLMVVATMPGTGKDEFALHRRFASSRSHGEWFNVTDDLREFICQIGAKDRLVEAVAVDLDGRRIVRAWKKHGPLVERQQRVIDAVRERPEVFRVIHDRVPDLSRGLVSGALSSLQCAGRVKNVQDVAAFRSMWSLA